jgi:polyhydroxyalkanoate synthase subunit PhaC
MKTPAEILGLLKRKPPPVGTTPADVVHHENKWRLLRYRAPRGGKRLQTPVLLVPSLINRHYVLDLLPGKSFAEYLVQQGHDVYCIDWGTPGPEDRYLTFDDVCDRYLGRAINRAARTAESEKVHLLGYCLGGTLTVAHAAARPERVASLALLAAPVRFADDGILAQWVNSKSFDLDVLVDAFGNIPWQLMQSAFQMIRPTLNLSKAMHLLDRAWSDEFLDGFFALETWGNDNVSFPGECYRRYIRELYREDRLAKGTFSLSGTPATLDRIHCPVLAVTFAHDAIVPWASASAVLELVSSTDKHHMHLNGGHVGAVVSKSAAKGLWPAISTFFRDRDSA